MTKEQVFEFIREQKTAMISSVDGDGFPNTKAMLSPRKIDGKDFLFYNKYLFNESGAV